MIDRLAAGNIFRVGGDRGPLVAFWDPTTDLQVILTDRVTALAKRLGAKKGDVWFALRDHETLHRALRRTWAFRRLFSATNELWGLATLDSLWKSTPETLKTNFIANWLASRRIFREIEPLVEAMACYETEDFFSHRNRLRSALSRSLLAGEARTIYDAMVEARSWTSDGWIPRLITLMAIQPSQEEELLSCIARLPPDCKARRRFWRIFERLRTLHETIGLDQAFRTHVGRPGARRTIPALRTPKKLVDLGAQTFVVSQSARVSDPLIRYDTEKWPHSTLTMYRDPRLASKRRLKSRWGLVFGDSGEEYLPSLYAEIDSQSGRLVSFSNRLRGRERARHMTRLISANLMNQVATRREPFCYLDAIGFCRGACGSPCKPFLERANRVRDALEAESSSQIHSLWRWHASR